MINPGDKFDRYRIVRKLGEGGMATVYEAENTFGLAVVLKLLNPSLANDPDVVERFRREGRIQYTLRHPHIVRVTDIVEDRGIPALVIDLLRGEDLEQALLGGKHFDVPEALEIVVKVLDALSAAHERGFIHRDLKPSNIFLDKTDYGYEPRLMDFGIAKIEQATALTRAQEFCGTPAYSSPEQIESTRDVDARTDVYSMGVVLWQLLANRAPYGEHTEPIRIMVAVVRENLPDLPSTVPLWLRMAVKRATAKSVDARFDSATTFRDALLEGIRSDQVLQQTVLLTSLPLVAETAGQSNAAKQPPGRPTLHTPIATADTLAPPGAGPIPQNATIRLAHSHAQAPGAAASAESANTNLPSALAGAPRAEIPSTPAPLSTRPVNPTPPVEPTVLPAAASASAAPHMPAATVLLPSKPKQTSRSRRWLAAGGFAFLVLLLALIVAVMAWDMFAPPQQIAAGFVRVEPGSYVRGSPDDELGRLADEVRQQVTITYPMAVQAREVSVSEFTELMFGRSTPFTGCGDRCPAVNVAWQDALEYANMLSIRQGFQPCYRIVGSGAERRTEWPLGVQCDGYRLPTEAEWEYFARAGSTTALPNGPLTITGRSPLDPGLAAIATYSGNSNVSYAGGIDCARWAEGFDKCGPSAVGSHQPNAFGLYDTSGNVAEWVWDAYAPWSASPQVDPVGEQEGRNRVTRGGSWMDVAERCRSAARESSQALGRISVGFRLVRTLKR